MHVAVNVTVNGEVRQLAEGTTVERLLGEMALPSQGVAVELNREIVPRSTHGETVVSEGDEIEIVTFVGGG